MAVAYDAESAGFTNSSSGSLTYSHTCTGTNRVLFVTAGTGGSTTVSGITYGGTSMTLVDSYTSTGLTVATVYLYVLVNPASGANNVVVTASASGSLIYSAASSYTGAQQIGQPVHTAKNSAASATSLTTTVNTSDSPSTDNCWVVGTYLADGNYTTSAGTSTTFRTSNASIKNWIGMMDTNAAVTPAGSRSLIFDNTQAGNMRGIIASVSPAPGPTDFEYCLDLESSSSQYASRADTTSLSITGDLTVESWVKFESKATAGNANMIVAKFTRSTNNRSYAFGWDNGFSTGSNRLFLIVDETGANDGNSTLGRTTWDPSTGVWYHVATTFDAGSPSAIALYIDGVSQTVTYDYNNANSIYDGNEATAIGVFDVGSTPINFFDGKFALTRLWSSVRSQSEIDTNKCVILGSTTNLAAEWTLNNTYFDNSGNANTLTPSGSPVFAVDGPSVCTVVGPAGVKTWNGVTQSTSVKTYLGVALASVKSVIGVT